LAFGGRFYHYQYIQIRFRGHYITNKLSLLFFTSNICVKIYPILAKNYIFLIKVANCGYRPLHWERYSTYLDNPRRPFPQITVNNVANGDMSIFSLGSNGQLITPDTPPEMIPGIVVQIDLMLSNNGIGCVIGYIKGFLGGRKSRKSRK